MRSPSPLSGAGAASSADARARSVPPTDEAGLERRYLYPGQFFCSRSPVLVTTILGSCVSVCLTDRASRVGGVNHFLLPHWAGSGRATPRFGNVAISSLIEGLLQLGARLSSLEAKVFGGASVLGGHPASGTLALGDRNVEVARRLLDQEGIPIVAEDVGGDRGRKLLFQSDDGTVWVKKL